MTKNADQVEFWNGPAAERWVRHQAELDRALEPFGRAALEAARPRAGERAVDVGCGCGWTTFALAEAVGAGGSVLGVDVSTPMLDLARARGETVANASFALADAAEHPFEPPVDLVFSRFGVMFFRDPVAAFANLRRALRPGGRAAFVCWGPAAENPWFRVPMGAAGSVVPLPEPAGPEEPGPFSFDDRGRVERVLAGAGFGGIGIARSSPDFYLGPDVETAATFAVETGPVSRLLAEADDATRSRVRAAIREALAPHVDAHGKGVRLPTSTWIVTASAA